MRKKFTPLCNYITETLNEKYMLEIGKDWDDVTDRLAKGEVGLAYLGPVPAIKAMEKKR